MGANEKSDINDEEIKMKDYETNQRLLAPYVILAKPGSRKKGVKLNVSTLEKECLIDELNTPKDSYFSGRILNGEEIYFLYSADSEYDTNELPNLLSGEIEIGKVKGYFFGDSIKNVLPKVYRYFLPSKEEKNQLPDISRKEEDVEDDIPF